MLTQFRLHYPQGSLLSELLRIDRGMYIVRCLVQVEGTTLATGMAAAQTVELAEDRARSRAIAALCLDESTTAKPKETPIPTHSVPLPPTAKAKTALRSQSLDPIPTTQVAATSQKTAVNGMPLSELEYQTQYDDEAIDLVTVEEKPIPGNFSVTEIQPSFEVLAEFDSPQVNPPSIAIPSTYNTPSAEVSVPPLSPAEFDSSSTSHLTPDIPMDMSEVMARTTVEMKRLGWTTQQGRDYLMGTYGKKSRHTLKDSELIAFLHYLESQPSPD
ncbi:MAG TPA: hypothetical protein DEG17_09920 [Cyanobacteria bacterium UBA11149]|nr:hypothetical protein [Cyanobacteria bacterium UBA11367]HBE61090.1 hypothetical protein [Cyanobacteria bacterium UBA11366]HBK62246.1 hypothetical protein [Cyanobacteria bacterium UBA11166]HBR73713.1 hypothetical protein [Cyanobacteria bacterium UBA11159]HBS72681.1 hypothetical protein [Cyanobacteria bacterium UBA11153]HBW89164.1 hypothetical protein [Cyanobacteria bacterium UBA11149]HCA94144.1 hypothetical protein [Cyanobacteria bacterium UBA9226]